MPAMRLATTLVRASAIIFAVVGLGYLLMPAVMLSIVGIGSAPTTDFLMRTEGVTLLAGAAFLWAVRDGRPDQLRLALAGLAGYYILGSIVDLAAFTEDIVGAASVPSAAIRIAVGVACVVAALRVPGAAGPETA
jgi:hypothetical protein